MQLLKSFRWEVYHKIQDSKSGLTAARLNLFMINTPKEWLEPKEGHPLVVYWQIELIFKT